MPSVLFVHENFPAQFGSLANALAAQGWNVVFATQKESIAKGKAHRLNSGVQIVRYERARDPRKNGHPYLAGTEKAVLNGQGLARLGSALTKGGFSPDVVVAHSGWGSGSFAKVVWPEAKLVQYLEWWYNYPAPDVDPDLETNRSPEDQNARTLVRNLPFLLDFQQADLVIAPTRYQADQCPDFVRNKTIVQHDGIDCTFFQPAQPDETFSLDGVPGNAQIVTFATRGMEPIRGFPTFMAAAEKILRDRPDLHVVIAGNPKAHYGPEPKDFDNWKDKALSDHSFDENRLHFIGSLPKEDYAKLLRRSDAHVYLTRPFVLSWSLLEAMATGAPIIASDVAPVREVAQSGTHAHLVPEKNPAAVCDGIAWCLDNPEAAKAMGLRAREQVIKTYEVQTAHQKLRTVLQELIANSQARKNKIL